jgi:hypothetical protein
MVRGLDGYLFPCPYLACAVFKLHRASRKIPVVHSERETPLPIPNRAVKPFSADGTWGATPWESRSPPVLLTNLSRPRGRLFVVLSPVGADCSGVGPHQAGVPLNPSGRGVWRSWRPGELLPSGYKTLHPCLMGPFVFGSCSEARDEEAGLLSKLRKDAAPGGQGIPVGVERLVPRGPRAPRRQPIPLFFPTG